MTSRYWHHVTLASLTVLPPVIKVWVTKIDLFHSSYSYTPDAECLTAVYSNFLDFGEDFPPFGAFGEVAVIAPPIRIPATGITATPRSGTAPLPTTRAATGRAPPATGTAAAARRRRTSGSRTGRPLIRPAAVTVATATMSRTNAAESGSEPTTGTSTAETTASCSVAR